MDKSSWQKRLFAMLLLCAAASIVSPAQTFTTLFNFNGANGAAPAHMSLIQGLRVQA
jgi:hypothetical protein